MEELIKYIESEINFIPQKQLSVEKDGKHYYGYEVQKGTLLNVLSEIKEIQKRQK